MRVASSLKYRWLVPTVDDVASARFASRPSMATTLAPARASSTPSGEVNLMSGPRLVPSDDIGLLRFYGIGM